MGYRDESEHLRHRVQELEGQLDVLRGKRTAGREESFAAKARRQTWIILVLAILGTFGAGLCGLPIAIALIEGRSVDAAGLSDRRHDGLVAFEGTVDPSQAFHGPGVYQMAAPLEENPRAVLYCDYACPPGFEAELESGAGSALRAYRGRVLRPGAYQFDRLSPELGTYAQEHGYSLDEIVLVELRRTGDDPMVPLFIMLGLGLLGALSLWTSLLWHRRWSRMEVPLPTAADFVTRDPGMTVMLTIVTCRLYELVWIFSSTSQLRRITGRPDMNPGLDALLSIATFGLWPFWVLYRNVEAVDEALTDLGEYSNARGTILGLVFGSFFCGLLQWALLYKAQEAYNRLIVEKMAVDDLPDA